MHLTSGRRFEEDMQRHSTEREWSSIQLPLLGFPILYMRTHPCSLRLDLWKNGADACFRVV